MLLATLPTELTDHILSFLDTADLARFARVSARCRKLSIPRLWHEVDLVDKDTSRDRFCSHATKHDDTAIIEKLLTIVNNDDIAWHVHSLNHSCYMKRPPLLRGGMWGRFFLGQTVSYDPRLLKLVELASAKMKNVHSVRIINGHPRLNEALIRCFFDAQRRTRTPVRRLWLENCSLPELLDIALPRHKQGLPIHIDFSSLKSFRIRRVHLLPYKVQQAELDDRQCYYPVICRRPSPSEPRDPSAPFEWYLGQADPSGHYTALSDYFSEASEADDKIFEAVAKRFAIPEAVTSAGIVSHYDRACWAYEADWSEGHDGKDSPSNRSMYRMDRPSAADCTLSVLQQSAAGLTSLTFDWIVQGTTVNYNGLTFSQRTSLQDTWFQALFRLRFPALRAFQLRRWPTAVYDVPVGISLFDLCEWHFPEGRDRASDGLSIDETGFLPLEFLEAHKNLRCLAWPMDHFFAASRTKVPTDRVDSVIERLANTLTDLRVDSELPDEQDYGNRTWDGDSGRTSSLQARRRRFIQEFASRLNRVEDIKVFGRLPLAEHREVLRALSHCRLQRIRLISAGSTIGNTWASADERTISHVRLYERAFLAAHHEDSIYELAYGAPLDKIPPFNPTYRWQDSAPMVTVISDYHRQSLHQLELCGSIGAVAILHPSAITHPMLAGLKHMHKLESLVMSLWVGTCFEGQFRDEEVKQFWSAPSSPTTTAITVVNSGRATENAWQAYLDELSSEKIAGRIVKLIGAHLSKTCLTRPGGMLVKGRFDIESTTFELGVWIGLDSQDQPCLVKYKGLSADFTSERRQSELDKYRWF